MVKREVVNKLLGVGVAGILILMIFFVLLPPATAVYLNPGSPDDTSVTTGTTITFSDVNLTIRGVERIPVNNLTFYVFNNADDSIVGYVLFTIDGTEIEDDPSGKFTVTNTTIIQSGWYTNGSQWGYDEEYLHNYTYSNGYGYGYGSGLVDITFLYDITYTTHTTGTFYAKLYVNSTSHTYMSAASTTFTVSSGGGGGGGGGGHPSGGQQGIAASQSAINAVQTQFGVTLSRPFYANDTDGAGIVDFFNDPNGVLSNVHFASVNGSPSFLISTNGDAIPECFWNTRTNSITPVTYAPGEIQDTYIDTTAEEVTIVVDVEKGEWIYLDIADAYPPNIYPGFTLTVKTADGRTISPNMIWRENDNIYLLDDPAAQYVFVYKYDILPPTFEPPNGTIFNATFMPPDGTTFNIARPTIVITYYETVEIIEATLDGGNVISQVSSTDQKTFTYTPTADLANGRHILSFTAEDTDGNTRTSTATYFIELPSTTSAPFPWIWVIIIIIAIIILVIIIYLILRKKLIV